MLHSNNNLLAIQQYNNTTMIFLLHGNHSFLRKGAKDEIVRNYRATDGNDVNYLSIKSSKDTENLNHLKSKLTTESLFGEKELVVVRLEETLDEPFITYLSHLSPRVTILIEVSVKLLATSKLLATVKKLDGEIRLFDMTAAKSKEALRTATRNYLAEEKIQINGYLLNKLIDYSQGDWWLVFTALDQATLLLKTLGRTQSDEQIAELWDIPEEQSIFRLFDAIGRGDQNGAISLLYEKLGKDQTKAGTEVESVLGFTSLMARQLRQLLAVKEEVNLSEAQKEWGIPVFAFSKLKSQASNFSVDLLKNAYWKLTEIQQKAKSGLYSPLLLVDFFVIYLISKRLPVRS